MKLFKEVHRRSMWQVLGLYVAGSWLVLQVIEALTNTASLPTWIPAMALVLLLVGLPIVLTTAFVQRGGPGRSRAATVRPFADPDTSAPGEAEGAPVAAPVEAPPETGAHHRLFTWKNAIAGGVLAFALVGLLAVGWMTSRSLGIGPADVHTA